jgi:hypothetical protein
MQGWWHKWCQAEGTEAKIKPLGFVSMGSLDQLFVYLDTAGFESFVLAQDIVIVLLAGEVLDSHMTQRNRFINYALTATNVA